MTIEPITITDKLGRAVVLRAAQPEDSSDLVHYLKVTSGESPYLIREPYEITITPEKEKAFILDKLDSERELMLVAFINGKHVGNCSLMGLAPYKRYRTSLRGGDCFIQGILRLWNWESHVRNST